MAEIDYKKAFDLVPYSWLKKCMRMFGVAEIMQKVLGNSMKKWKTELMSGGQKFGEKNIEPGERYKYLGIMEADRFKNLKMKGNVRKEYFHRTKKILKSKLNSGNVVTVINSNVAAVIRYSAGLIK